MTTSEIPHHRHRYPQGDLPPLATPGKTTPQTAPIHASEVPERGWPRPLPFAFQGALDDMGDEHEQRQTLNALMTAIDEEPLSPLRHFRQ